MDSKKWFLGMILNLTIVFTVCILCVFIIDPFMHYRKATHGLIFHTTTETDVESCLNSGIIKNFEYNAVITGSSMTENFKTSEFDSLFDVHSVKLPLSGSTFKDINDLSEKALVCNPNLKMILRGLDLSKMNTDKDSAQYNICLDYLYDDNSINDVNYLLSKNALFKGCMIDLFVALTRGKSEFSFDRYANWNDGFDFGKETVLSTYVRQDKADCVILLSDEEREQIRGNVEQNIVELVKKYPNTEFILFLTPYSICYWDGLSQTGTVRKEIQIQQEVIELLLPYPNIELYSFCDDFELVSDLDNYRDQAHYGEDVNTDILRWIAQGRGKLTGDNYEAYLEKIAYFYENYDYDSLYR